jgi:hypothetical protein
MLQIDKITARKFTEIFDEYFMSESFSTSLSYSFFLSPSFSFSLTASDDISP